MSDEELAAALDAPVEVAPALRGARDLNEARAYANAILTPPPPAKVDAPETLERFRELVERTNGGIDARSVVRELKAVGGNLRALRLALTGQERGPELWTVIAALPRDETLRRIDASLTPSSRRSQGSQAGGAQDSAERHGQAPPAPDPAASGGSPSRSPAPPGGSEGPPTT
jgi:hypothetical protein